MSYEEEIKIERELLDKISSFDKDTLRVMLYSINDIDELKQLIEVGENFIKARSIIIHDH